jgi:hypothetical protein
VFPESGPARIAPAPAASPVALPLAGVLRLLLPTATESALLRALLWPADRGAGAWASWRTEVGGLRAALERNAPGLNGLLPLLGHALRASGVTLSDDDRACLRSAQLWESARYAAYRAILLDALARLAVHRIPTILLDGAALAQTVYETPVLRHCHAIALWVPDAQLATAATLLIEGGLRPDGLPGGTTPDLVALHHESGLPIRLGSGLLRPVFPAWAGDELWDRSGALDLSGTGTRILGDADALLHVCGRAATVSRESPLVWAADAWFILRRRAALDWHGFLEGVRRANLALPLAAMLAYLAGDLEAPVPDHVLTALEHAARRTDGLGRQIAVAGVHRAGRAGLRALARGTSCGRDRLTLARWVLLPSPKYARCVGGARSTGGVLRYYVARALRYARRRWTASWSRTPGARRGDGEVATR